MISGETVEETILVGNPTCHACPVACKKEVEITEGAHAGLRMESFEYESAWALGANCDLSDAAAVSALIAACNEYGLDTIESGNALSVAMEATQHSLLNGDGLAWGIPTACSSFFERSLTVKASATISRTPPLKQP
jgi:aldehyde:ferredoxin oxidoreductase